MALKWRRDGTNWTSGDWRIEKVWAPPGTGWYVSAPIDGGYFDTLADAKSCCELAQTRADIEQETNQ